MAQNADWTKNKTNVPVNNQTSRISVVSVSRTKGACVVMNGVNAKVIILAVAHIMNWRW